MDSSLFLPVGSGTSAGAAGGTQAKDPWGKDTFMKLLLAQMSNPDPFAPQDAGAFMDQIVQYGVLERLIELEERVRELNRSQALAQAAAIIGREVTVRAGEETVEGVVERVTMNEEGASVVISGQNYPFDQVVEVR